MATYKAVKLNKVWRYLINGVPSSQIDAIPIGRKVEASDLNNGCLNLSNGYTKKEWFEFVPSTLPPDDQEDPPDLPTSTEWKRYYFLNDWQSPVTTHHAPYTPRGAAPAPEVNRIGELNAFESHNKVLLTQGIQFFWADLIAFQCYGRAYAACDSTQKIYIGKRVGAMMGPNLAFTNRSDPEAANYFTGEWLDKEPAKLAALICGGNTVWGKPVGKNIDGREMVQIYSFLAGQQLPVATAATLLDARVQWATIIYDTGSVGPFPQLRGLSVPVPVITDKLYYYPADGLQEYAHGDSVKSQYFPPLTYYP